MYPLAFDIVPSEFKVNVIDFLKQKGMACSVFGAQYLLEALFLEGEDDYAMELMTARNDRSWAHMIYDLGSTITLEAWDEKFKPNLDWNHAWGSAPANIISRYIMGIKPLEPGFSTFLIKPQTGHLSYAAIRFPSIKGNIDVSFQTDRGSHFSLKVLIPANTNATVLIPSLGSEHPGVKLDGQMYMGEVEGDFIRLEAIGPGSHKIERNV